jgi:tRNA (guanine-N7-)-methyltransferase
MHFFNKIYYKFFKKFSIKTVHVRGRLSEEEEKLFQESKHLLPLSSLHTWTTAPGKKVLEIGFGNGQHLVGLAGNAKSGENLLGVELYKAGIVKVLKEIDKKQLTNLKVLYADAREVMDELSDGVVDRLYILFPDPWPKVRHHKRRLLQEGFIRQCVKKLSANGEFYIATDWENYAENIEGILMSLRDKKVLNYSKVLESVDTQSIRETTFAKRAEKEGREIVVFKIKRSL